MQTLIKRTCGHQAVEQLYGPGAERTRKAAWLATQPCLTCSRQTATVTATTAAVAAGLPALTGSEKQVEWAARIRVALLAEIKQVRASLDARAAKHPGPAADEVLAVADKAIAALESKSEARFWIDSRDLGGMAVLKAEMARLSN